MKALLNLRERLSARRALVGFLQIQPNPWVAELASLCGYDFVILDDEHGLFSAQDHLRTLHAVGGGEMAVLVRVSGHDPQKVGRYLDMGAHGLVVPNVSTAEQARAFARAMEYPPNGTRGFGAAAHRSTNYGIDLAAHMRAPRAGLSLLLIIESAAGVANVDSILEVEGVDGVIVGPSDLSTSLGCTGDFSTPQYAEALACIERAAAGRGKILGTAPHAEHTAEALLSRGHRLLIMGSDISLMREAMRAQVHQGKILTAE